MTDLSSQSLVEVAPCRQRAVVEAWAKLHERLGDGEFYVQGDRFELVFRPGGGSFASLDQVVAKMACGETAYWLPGVVASLLNAALQPPAADTRTEDGLADKLIADAIDYLLADADAWETGAENATHREYLMHSGKLRRDLAARLGALRTTGQPAIAAAKPVGEADV